MDADSCRHPAERMIPPRKIHAKITKGKDLCKSDTLLPAWFGCLLSFSFRYNEYDFYDEMASRFTSASRFDAGKPQGCVVTTEFVNSSGYWYIKLCPRTVPFEPHNPISRFPDQITCEPLVQLFIFFGSQLVQTAWLMWMLPGFFR